MVSKIKGEHLTYVLIVRECTCIHIILVLCLSFEFTTKPIKIHHTALQVWEYTQDSSHLLIVCIRDITYFGGEQN